LAKFTAAMRRGCVTAIWASGKRDRMYLRDLCCAVFMDVSPRKIG